MNEITGLSVFWFALITAVATGLGALPFLFFKKFTSQWIGVFNAIAAGLMLAASFGLIYEGVSYDLVRVLMGVMLGLVFILGTRHFLSNNNDRMTLGALQGVDAKKALILVGVMTLHSFTEGIGIGVSFGGGAVLGLFITIAIAVHNIPEGLAISAVLVPRGVPVWRAAFWSIFSSLPQPLMAVPAFLFVEAFRPFLPVGLGFAAGAMIWMVFSEILPDALKEASPNLVAITITISIAVMIAFQVLLKTSP